jgi:mannitol-specific phosphotransferase system IIBC component
MKSVPAWVLYTVYRILAFAVPLAILLLLGIEPWLAALLAAIIGFCLSYILLRTRREEVARDLYAATQRAKKAPVRSDDETEDAAIEQAQVSTPTTSETATSAGGSAARRASEGEGSAEQNAVSQPGETGEFQGKNELR